MSLARGKSDNSDEEDEVEGKKWKRTEGFNSNR